MCGMRSLLDEPFLQRFKMHVCVCFIDINARVHYNVLKEVMEVNIGFREDMTHEFKSDKNKLQDSEIVDAVVAFANTDGGELYLGVEDTGEISGLHKDHMDITRLAAFIANKTVPSVPVRCEILDLALPILKITVPRRTSITASSSGKIQRRRLKANGEPENVPMYPYEIAGRLSDLSLFDYSAQPVPNGEYRDLDPVERERLRRIIRDYHGEAALLELDNEGLDQSSASGSAGQPKAGAHICGPADDRTGGQPENTAAFSRDCDSGFDWYGYSGQ